MWPSGCWTTCSVFTATDSPASAGSHAGECQEGHDAEAGPDAADAEDGDVTGQAPTREGCIWPVSFLLSNIRGLVGVRGKNKSPFLHDLALARNSLWLAVTESWLNPGVLDSELLVHMPGYSVQTGYARQTEGWFLSVP